MEKYKIIDAHSHCTEKSDLNAEFFWYDQDYESKINHRLDQMQRNKIDRSLIYILDEKAVLMNCRPYPKLTFALMIEFRKSTAVAKVKQASRSGFKGVKILTYEQKVEKKDYPAILKMAKEVEKCRMFLTICATFGGKDPLKHDALALARYLLQKGYKGNLILAHAGGLRVNEAMLIGDSSPNVFFDTSFTTTHWRNSSIITDLAFAIKKFPKRFFFGSDSPNVGFSQAKDDSLIILKGFPEKIKRDYFYNNINNFLQNYE